MGFQMENNNVVISGKITDIEYSHEFCGETFYMAYIESLRTSDVADVIPVTVSERLIKSAKKIVGKFVKVSGQFRSRNEYEEGAKRLKLSVFARNVEYLEENESFEYVNEVFLDGFICKETVLRTTPLGREIADVLLAVNRSYGKSDYIPCICWGRNATFINTFDIGTRCRFNGRIQSRNYNKKMQDGTYQERTAYELSVSMLQVGVEVEDEEQGD